MSSVAVASPDALTLSAFQARVLEVPEDFDLALLGGRGGGKSFTLMLLALRHCDQYKAQARVSLRPAHASRDAGLVGDGTRLAVSRIYGTALRYNSDRRHLRLPGGGSIELQPARDRAGPKQVP